MGFNIKEMNYVIAVAKEKSYTKAAKQLDKNPSSLTRCIRRLEQELEVSLFRRTPEGLVATAEGESYLAAAIDIVELERQLY